MRPSLVALALLVVTVTALAQAPEGPIIAGAYAAQLRNAIANPNSTHRDLVALYLAKQLGYFRQSTTQAFIKAADATRTDQQLTGSSSTPGSVTNLEKTGIADLFAVAIERGAVAQAMNGTNTTLSTTPYAMLTTLGTEDTPANWMKLAWARRVSLAGTFSSNTVVSGDFSSFVSGEAKFILLGNRSPRDVGLTSEIGEHLNAAIARVLGNKGVTCSTFFQTTVGAQLPVEAFDTYVLQHPTATPADLETTLSQLMTLPPTLDRTTEEKLTACVLGLGELQRAEEVDVAQIKALTDSYLAQNKTRQVTVAYLYQRDPSTADYTTLKVLLGRDQSPAYSANLNAQLDLNQRSRTTTGTPLKHVRGYSAEAGLTSGRFGGGRGDLTFSVKWYTPKGETGSALSAQGKLNIHVTDTFMVPVALTYANRTLAPANAKKGLQVDFGVAALLDHLLANALAR
jgi:hypothetical protein